MLRSRGPRCYGLGVLGVTVAGSSMLRSWVPRHETGQKLDIICATILGSISKSSQFFLYRTNQIEILCMQIWRFDFATIEM